MQFEPATFAQYGVSVTNPNAPADPEDPQDAIYTAARYLHASGAPGDWPAAIFAYNHADWYVAEVQALALRYSGVNGLANLTADISAAWGDRQQPTMPAATTVYVSDSGLSAAQAGALSRVCPGTIENTDVTPVPGLGRGDHAQRARAPTAKGAELGAGDDRRR